MVSNFDQASSARSETQINISPHSPLCAPKSNQWQSRKWEYLTTHKLEVFHTVGVITGCGLTLAGISAIYGALLIEAATPESVSLSLVLIPSAVITLTIGCLFGTTLACHRVYKQYLEWLETQTAPLHVTMIN